MRSAVAVGPVRQGGNMRSIGAVAAGAAVAIVLSVATDVGMQAAGLMSVPGQPQGYGTLLSATVYRTVYGVLAGFVTARLAPNRPMRHALAGSALGLAACVIGAAATWNSGLGAHWYPVALTLLAMPQAWVGGRLGALTRERS